MLARFFIDRPIFAWVITIVILGAGFVAQRVLPVAQYPEITPPTVQVNCVYPGADSRVVQDSVAAPIEQQVNGVENMLYMSSTSANDGSYFLNVTFKLGVDLNMAQVLVQNRVSQAMPKLPPEVQASGVTVKKRSPSILLAVNLFSATNPDTNEAYFDQLYLSNYATIYVKDELARLDGVGDLNLLGQQDYSMRVWLDPEKLASRNLATVDVVKALKEQNVQVAAGQIGQPPVPKGTDFQYNLTTLGRLIEENQFADIVIKTGSDGQVTHLEDVGRIELGAQNMNTQCRLDQKPAVGLAVFQLPGSNAMETAKRVKNKMRELQKQFPQGLEYGIVYDTTPFIEESIAEVFKTLRDAIILVALVVLFFLQDWRAVILPLIDVAVSLIGTFAIMLLMGFTLNTLTLFGLVLAIGIVVDDAIVVLENIERWIGKGFKVREATIHAMDEITGPIIAITLVLSSVFLPSAFLPGITGQFYRQFALTIAVSMMLSAVNAMTMTPARAGSVFKDPEPGGHREHQLEALPWWGIGFLVGYLAYWILQNVLGLGSDGHEHEAETSLGSYALLAGLMVPGLVIGWVIHTPVNRVLGVFFKGFNRVFDRITLWYGGAVAWCVRLSFIVLVVYGGLLFLTYLGFTRLPTGFIPDQDQGYLVADMQLPDSSSLERTVETMKKLEKIAAETPGVGHTLAVAGQSFLLNTVASNFAGIYIVLKPFHERHGDSQMAPAVIAAIRARAFREIEEARVAVFGAPPIQGLGNTGGYKIMIKDRGDGGLDKLQGMADHIADQANKQPGLVGFIDTFRANTPQLYADVDRTKCKTMGLALSDVFNTLQVFLGGYYVNDFNKFGRTWQVNIQADAQFRLSPENVKLLRVRNDKGEMVPLGAVIRIQDSSGPILVTRYNMKTAAAVTGGSLPGVSSGSVIQIMEDLCRKELPSTMDFEWTEITYLQLLAGNTAIFAFLGAVILVFLVLAAQYESWSMPIAIILVVPMCLLAACAGVAMRHYDINIFVQVGFVVLVGLASKNAILVVEFAKELQKNGTSAFDAAVEASKARLRPIIMTSFAFILGVFPLVIGTGAGAEMRNILGTAVFSGMIGVTAFGLFLTPVFYYVVMKLIGQSEAKPVTPPTTITPPAH